MLRLGAWRGRKSPLIAYPMALGLMSLAVVLHLGLDLVIPGNHFLFLFPAIILAALIAGPGPGLAASAAGVAVGWYFFVPPFWSLRIATSADAVEAALFALSAGLVSWLALLLTKAQDRARALAVGLEGQVRARTRELEAAYEDLKTQIAERAVAEEAVRHLQKLEIMGQLTGSVAHDFNNVLAVVMGNLELLEARLSDERALRLVRNSAHAVRRGAALTEQLLAYARRQRLEPQPTALDLLIHRMRDILSRSLGSAVAVTTRLQPGLWPAFVDANQVETAILNLAINARDAMPEGGALRIEAANLRLDGAERRPDKLAPGDYVVLAVADTGTGMSEEVMRNAFDPFYTTKEPGKGTGLGLSQVYGLATQSGGTAVLESRLGQGTIVRLYLPRAADGISEEPAERDAARLYSAAI